MDRLPSRPLAASSPAPGLIKSGALMSTSTDWSQPLSQAISAFPSLAAQVSHFNYNKATDTLSGSNTMASSLLGDTSSMSSDHTKYSTQEGPFSLAMQWAPQSTSLPSPQTILGTPSNLGGVHVSGTAPPASVPKCSSGTWEDALTTETNLDKLTALNKTAQHNSTAHNLSLEEIADFNKEMFEIAHKSRLAQQEAQKRLVSMMSNTMSGTLSELYVLYLKEASRLAPDPETERKPNIVPTSVLMHENDAMATEYKISSPQLHLQYYEDDEDEDQIVDIDSMMAFFVVTRTPCMKSCCAIAGKKRTKELPVPCALRWRNDAKIPDGCPVCHKVLFLKNKADAKSSLLAPGSNEGWLAFEEFADGLSDGDL